MELRFNLSRSVSLTLTFVCLLVQGFSPNGPFRDLNPILDPIDDADYLRNSLNDKLKQQWRPCAQVLPGLDLPCLCAQDEWNGTLVNCDGLVFVGDFPVLPFRSKIHGYSQKRAGYQTLSSQLFTASDIPLRILDISHNSIGRLTERLFEGVDDTLEELYLQHNLLGEQQLNPIFTTNELQQMRKLRVLDLSSNGIKALDDGLLHHCEQLEELHLERNSLSRVPTRTLQGPPQLHSLHLQLNRIVNIPKDAFPTPLALLKLNISHNVISKIEGGAFEGLVELQQLDLRYNKLLHLSEQSLEGLSKLDELNLDDNFFSAIPIHALRKAPQLKRLSLASNLIQGLESSSLDLPRLEYLDLSRNNIADLPQDTFVRLEKLQTLVFSVNTLRKVEEYAFKGLEGLEAIFLDDNNILLVPQPALQHLRMLKTLSLAFNRIAVVSSESFSNNTALEEISLSFNVIRELPANSFGRLLRLKRLYLRGNQLVNVNNQIFGEAAGQLQELDLGYNKISQWTPLNLTSVQTLLLDYNNLTVFDNASPFAGLEALVRLNLSYNRLEALPSAIFQGLPRLTTLDLRNNRISKLPAGLFRGLPELELLYLQNNDIKVLESSAVAILPSLVYVNLARNALTAIHDQAFDRVPQLKRLILKQNRLDRFGPLKPNNVTELDLSYNQLSRVTSNTLANMTRLRVLDLSHNVLRDFHENSLRDLRFVQKVSLAHNKLETLGQFTFGKLFWLQSVDVSHNGLTNISEAAFQQSPQLQFINLGYNRLRGLPDQPFDGLVRLNLNLEHNRLSKLASTIFERSRVQKLQSIFLNNNFFEALPVEALQKQFFFLDHVNMAHNRIREIPTDSNLLVTAKTLDLSFNPLTEEAIVNVLSEPKTVKYLNMAGTGITKMPILETPFLRHLNLSSNRIDLLTEAMFQKPSALEVADLSHNRISQLSVGLANVWAKLPHLQELYLSHNPITQIQKSDLASLPSLRVLRLDNLPDCTKLESQVFAQLPSLRELWLFGWPRLDALDARAVLRHFNTLESLQLEVTEALLQDQLSPAFLPRLRVIHVHGRGGLRAVSPAALAGTSSPDLKFVLHDTAVTSLPASLLFPVPMSTNMHLDVAGAKLGVLSPQFLAAADNHGPYLRLTGLKENPIFCDCNARPFRRWLKNRVAQALHPPSPSNSRRPRQSGVGVSFAVVGNPEDLNLEGGSMNFDPDFDGVITHVDRNVLVRVQSSLSGLGSTPNLATRSHTAVSTDGEGEAQVWVVTVDPSDVTVSPSPVPKPAPALLGLPDLLSRDDEDSQEDNETSENELDLDPDVGEFAAIACSSPPALLGVRLIDMAEEELSCEGKGHGEVVAAVPNDNDVDVPDTMEIMVAARPRPFTPPLLAAPSSHPSIEVVKEDNEFHEEPVIIWKENDIPHGSQSSGTSKDHSVDDPKGTSAQGSTSKADANPSMNNMDALIIGIVGGVVAFIAILIIIICLVRLRTGGRPYQGGPLAGPLALRHKDKCTCLAHSGGGQPPMLCHCVPGYPGHALHGHGPPLPQALSLPPLHGHGHAHGHGTAGRSSLYSALPRKMLPAPPTAPASLLAPRSVISTGSRSGFYPPIPYYVTFPPEKDKEHR